MFARFKQWLADRREAKIKRIWDDKSNDSILVAYHDATDWLCLENNGRIKLPDSLRDSCNMRLEKYIRPQMAKRGL